MKNPEKQKEENLLESLEEIISSAPERIEKEYSITQNTWMTCFGSIVFQIETYLGPIKRRGLISEQQYIAAIKNLNEIKVKLQELKKQYPDKDSMLPEEIKQNLLNNLNNILKEEKK